MLGNFTILLDRFLNFIGVPPNSVLNESGPNVCNHFVVDFAPLKVLRNIRSRSKYFFGATWHQPRGTIAQAKKTSSTRKYCGNQCTVQDQKASTLRYGV